MQLALVQTLTDRDQDYFGPALPPGLRELYTGDLRFRESPAERPLVIANFVSSIERVLKIDHGRNFLPQTDTKVSSILSSNCLGSSLLA